MSETIKTTQTESNDKNCAGSAANSSGPCNTRSEILRFRVTPEEREKIERKALGSYRTVSRYLRDCALGKEITVIPGVDDLASELRRVGNNLNQITRAVNSGYTAGIDGVSDIQEGVKRIWQSLNSLRRDAR